MRANIHTRSLTDKQTTRGKKLPERILHHPSLAANLLVLQSLPPFPGICSPPSQEVIRFGEQFGEPKLVQFPPTAACPATYSRTCLRRPPD